MRETGIRFRLGKLCEDGVFAYEILAAAARVGIVAHAGYNYRLSENSIQRTQDVSRKIQFVMNGFVFAAGFFDEKLREIDSKTAPAWHTKTEEIRNYYLLFLLFRLLDRALPQAFVAETLANLRARKMFPFSRKSMLRGRKYALLYHLLNGEWRFAFFRACLRTAVVFKIVVILTGATSFKFYSKKRRVK